MKGKGGFKKKFGIFSKKCLCEEMHSSKSYWLSGKLMHSGEISNYTLLSLVDRATKNCVSKIYVIQQKHRELISYYYKDFCFVFNNMICVTSQSRIKNMQEHARLKLNRKGHQDNNGKTQYFLARGIGGGQGLIAMRDLSVIPVFNNP